MGAGANCGEVVRGPEGGQGRRTLGDGRGDEGSEGRWAWPVDLQALVGTLALLCVRWSHGKHSFPCLSFHSSFLHLVLRHNNFLVLKVHPTSKRKKSVSPL